MAEMPKLSQSVEFRRQRSRFLPQGEHSLVFEKPDYHRCFENSVSRLLTAVAGSVGRTTPDDARELEPDSGGRNEKA